MHYLRSQSRHKKGVKHKLHRETMKIASYLIFLTLKLKYKNNIKKYIAVFFSFFLVQD